MSQRPDPIAAAVFGVSTPFAYRIFEMTARICEAIAGKTLRVHANTMEELREGFQRRDGGSVIVTSDLPEPDLAAVVCRSDLPLIVVADTPERTLAWAMESRRLDATEAVRFLSQMYASLAAPFAAPEALRLSPASDSLPSSIAWRLFPELDADRPERRLRDAELETPAEQPVIGAFDVFASARATVDAYHALALEGPTDLVAWPLELFTAPEPRAAKSQSPQTARSPSLLQPIDLTGPARVLFYGPYLRLPPGEWIARVEFEIAGAISGVEATTDVRLAEVVVEKHFEMPAAGVFAYELAFQTRDPRQPVEIRLFTRRSAIEGVFLARSVTVRRA